MKIALSIETLEQAYDICILVKHQCANVIASGDYIKVDVEWYNKSKNFIDHYERALRAKPERLKYRGDWIKKLESSIGKLNDAINDLENEI